MLKFRKEVFFMFNKRGAGVIMHISSVPSQYGIGVFDKNCFDFADKLAEMKFSYWQGGSHRYLCGRDQPRGLQVRSKAAC